MATASRISIIDNVTPVASWESFVTLKEYNQFVDEKISKKSETKTPEEALKSLKKFIARKIRPNITANFTDVEYLTFVAVLSHCPEDNFVVENKRNVVLPVDRVLPKYYGLLNSWFLNMDDPIEVDLFDLLDTIDPRTYLYRNIGTVYCYDYFFDESLVNYRAFLVFWETRRRNFKKGRLILNNRIQKCFLDLVANAQFVQLDIEEVCILLESSSIGTNSELEVFMAAVKWINYNWHKRKKYVSRIAKCVRFELIEPWFIMWLIQDEADEIKRMIAKKTVYKPMLIGMEYSLNQMHFAKDPLGFTVFLLQHNILEPIQRSWIYDKDCKYHHKLDCLRDEGFTYSQFTSYMKELKQRGRESWKSFVTLDNSECPCEKGTKKLKDFIKNELPRLQEACAFQRERKIKLFEVYVIPKTQETRSFLNFNSLLRDGDSCSLSQKNLKYVTYKRNPSKKDLCRTTLAEYLKQITAKNGDNYEEEAASEPDVNLEVHESCTTLNLFAKMKANSTVYRKTYMKFVMEYQYTDKYKAGLKYLNQFVTDDKDCGGDKGNNDSYRKRDSDDNKNNFGYEKTSYEDKKILQRCDYD